MIAGIRYNADSLAQEFEKKLAERREALKKFAQVADEVPATVEQVYEKPEDFLVAPEVAVDEISSALDSQIKEMSGESVSCESCGSMEHSAADCMPADDVSYLVSAQAVNILEGLGKVAGSLRNKGQNFAADMVEATAMSIRNDLVKEAETKLEIVSSLKKMASELSASGDVFSADMVNVTIEKIKRN
jgi:hypothetical protein